MKAAAFFDVDGTLVRCLTQKVLARLMIRKKWISRLESFRIALWFLGYKLGLFGGSDGIRKQTYLVFNRVSKEDVDKLFREVYSKFIRPEIRSYLRQKIEAYKKAEVPVFAVSGSIHQLCEPLCQDLLLDGLFATKLSFKGDRYTGEWQGDILEGQKKVDLMHQLSKRHGFDLSVSYAYADSYSDVPMLEAVGHPAAVSPDPRLRAYAKKKNWEILEI